MSNRIDFFQPEQNTLALAASRVSVFLDGTICPYLAVTEIVHDGWPDFSSARLMYNPAACSSAEPKALEEVGYELSPGRNVTIKQLYNGADPDICVSSVPLFTGQIEKAESTFSSDTEAVEITARDFSAAFRRITVYGRRVFDITGASVFLPGSDTIFNAQAEPNASTASVVNNGSAYTVFAPEARSARSWSYAEVIDYLLCEYLVVGQLHRPSLEVLDALSGSQKASDLDITGLDLLEALFHCCERVGLKFKFVPRLSETGPRQTIIFYRHSTARVVELSVQPPRQRLSISSTDVAKIQSRKKFWPVTHRYVAQGDFKVFEATFELVKAWNSDDESNDYDQFSPTMNPDFYKVKDVYRKWALNEAGDYSAEPYNRGEAFDFSEVFGTSDYVHRQRRFGPTLTVDNLGQSLGYFVEVSYDNGLHWWQHLYAYNVLLDECGIWLSSDRLDVDTWIAAVTGTLKFRITASVISDERLGVTVTDGPVNSVIPVVDHVLTLPRQFRYRKVSNKSIFAGSNDAALGKADEADDSAALQEFVRKWAGAKSELIETVDLQTAYPALHYQLGDKITTGPDSRDLLGLRLDSRSMATIEKIRIDFANQQTELKIARRRDALL